MQQQAVNTIEKEAPDGGANDNRPTVRRRAAKALKAVFGKGRWLALVALVGLVVLRVYDPSPVQILRLKSFDAYQVLKPREATDNLVTVVVLDEDSLAEIGQLPW